MSKRKWTDRMAQIVLGELIRSLIHASERMSAKNPNKVTLLQAAEVLMQMGQRVGALEAQHSAQHAALHAESKALVLTDG